VLRTALLYVFPAILIASNWLRLEDPRGSGSRVAWVVILALAPALVRSGRLRVLTAVIATLLAVRSAFGLSPLDARPFDGRHDFFGPLWTSFRRGFLDFYDVPVAFDPRRYALMHGVILLAVFAFCLVLALGIAARRPVPAGLALVVGAGWPATLLTGGNELLRGTLILAGVLVLLAGLSARDGESFARALPAAAAVALAALAASTSPAVAKGEFLNWQTWDFYTRPQSPVSVSYVWDSNYTGIRFPKKVTTVLRVKAPATSFYWRATTLDVFDGRGWIEDVDGQLLRPGEPIQSRTDALLPAAAAEGRNRLRQDVTIEALRDTHLPAASVPVAYDLDPHAFGGVRFGRNEMAYVPQGVQRDQTYTVWSYAPEPTPAQLDRSPPRYPLAIDLRGYLDVQPGIGVPPFGAPDRVERVRKLFDIYSFDPGLQAYRTLFATAERLVGGATTPYAAAIRLESWFRNDGGFQYDEQPPLDYKNPPLVSFLKTKRGYCQHYAGAMALMLRYLGIPARVAAGFTSGRYDYDHGVWKVTDHDAHDWVEVWFAGYGWLPFDPTPARGRLSGAYTAASRTFDSRAVERILASVLRKGESGIDYKQNRFGEKGAGPTGERATGLRRAASSPGSAAARGASLLRLIALILGVIVLSIAAAKLALRRSRYLTRDPRRLAAACRRELSEFLADQRIEIPASATLRELGEAVDQELAVDAERFVAAATEARYAPPEEARDGAARARQELRALQRLIRSRLSLGERARGLLSLRSLGFSS
jgi:transglutaminase-like putative cysteine protease